MLRCQNWVTYGIRGLYLTISHKLKRQNLTKEIKMKFLIPIPFMRRETPFTFVHFEFYQIGPKSHTSLIIHNIIK